VPFYGGAEYFEEFAGVVLEPEGSVVQAWGILTAGGIPPPQQCG
jgi:hypothetical protein